MQKNFLFHVKLDGYCFFKVRKRKTVNPVSVVLYEFLHFHSNFVFAVRDVGILLLPTVDQVVLVTCEVVPNKHVLKVVQLYFILLLLVSEVRGMRLSKQ
jgi:hypothetical protein